MPLGSTRRFGKKVTRKERQLKYSVDERVLLTKENPNDFKILMALYFYRALSSDQLFRLGATGMKKTTLWGKLMYLTERRVIKTFTESDKPTGALYTKFRYTLTDLGLETILATLDVPRKQRGKPNHYYSLDDLRLGAQKKHHYLTVDWISRTQKLIHDAGAGLVVPDSEWRRFYRGDPKGEPTTYKPDWIMYEPHVGAKAIVESERYELHPFLYPLPIRDEYLSTVYQSLEGGMAWNWRDFFKPMLVVEMDTGSMNHKELAIKYNTIIEALERDKDFPKMMVFVNYVERLSPRLNKEKGDNVVLDLQAASRKRLSNTRRNLIDILNNTLLSDDLLILHGDEYDTLGATADYVVHNQQLTSHLPHADISSIGRLLVAHNILEARNAQVVDPRSAEGVIGRDLSAYGAGLPDYCVFQDAEINSEERFQAATPKLIDFVFCTRKCFVNAQAKALAFAIWLSSGEEWPNVVTTRVVLLYPDQEEFRHDVYPTKYNSRVLMASYADMVSNGMWGRAFARVPIKKRGPRWIEVGNGKVHGEGDIDDNDDD